MTPLLPTSVSRVLYAEWLSEFTPAEVVLSVKETV